MSNFFLPKAWRKKFLDQTEMRKHSYVWHVGTVLIACIALILVSMLVMPKTIISETFHENFGISNISLFDSGKAEVDVAAESSTSSRWTHPENKSSFEEVDLFQLNKDAAVSSMSSRWTHPGNKSSFEEVDLSKLNKDITRALQIRMVTYSDRLAACLAGSDPTGDSCLAVKPIYDINKAYADFHNYSFTVHSERKLPLLPHPWEKIALIKEVLVGADAVLWIDHDAYIQHTTFSLSSWLKRNPMRHLILSEHNLNPWELNTGIFLIRNSNWSFELLDSVLQRSDCDVFRANTDCCWEQDCLQHIAKNKLFTEWDNNVLGVPAHLFNCRSEWKGMESCGETGFAYHFMGQPKGYREIHGTMQNIHPKAGCGNDIRCRLDDLNHLDPSSAGQDQGALFAAAFNSVQKIVPPGLLSICHFSLDGGQIVPQILSVIQAGVYVIFEDVESENFRSSYYTSSDYLRASYPGIIFLFFEGEYNETVAMFRQQFPSSSCDIILWNQALKEKDLVALDSVWSPSSLVLLNDIACNDADCFGFNGFVIFDYLPCRLSGCSDMQTLQSTLRSLNSSSSNGSGYVLQSCSASLPGRLMIGSSNSELC
jgi:hypothetical protein